LLLARNVMSDDFVLKIDGHDNAVIGMTCNTQGNPVLVYSMGLIIDNLVTNDDLTMEEAHEFFWSIIARVVMGPDTPLIVYLDNGEYFNEINVERSATDKETLH
jgi:hypothetical protein